VQVGRLNSMNNVRSVLVRDSNTARMSLGVEIKFVNKDLRKYGVCVCVK
jgi:hypothetical protein